MNPLTAARATPRTPSRLLLLVAAVGPKVSKGFGTFSSSPGALTWRRLIAGSKNKTKDVPVNHSQYAVNGDISMDYGDGGTPANGGPVKRGRGRPKGSKVRLLSASFPRRGQQLTRALLQNKPGHKAGRPRKSGIEEGEAGFVPFSLRAPPKLMLACPPSSPGVKRQRTQSPHPANALAAFTQQQQQQQGRPLPQANDTPHETPADIPCDIPVDPSLMSGQRSNHAAPAAQPPNANAHFTLPEGVEIPSAETTSAAIAFFAREEPTHEGQNVASGSSSNKVDKGKGKGVAVDEDVSLNNAIHDLLPKDGAGNVPLVSGPFQLVEKDGKRRLEGPIEAASIDTNSGPVYVYIANFQPGQGGQEGEESTAAFAPWKITHPLTSEGKDRVRGPRRCGHCGKMECRGRGGRTWCPEYQEGVPGILPAKARSPMTTKEEDEDQLALSGSTPARTQPQRTYSSLSNFRADEGTPSTSSNQFDLAASDSGDRISESVTLLIQSILPQTRAANVEHGEEHDHEVFSQAFGSNEGYNDPGAPSSSNAPYAPGAGLYGSPEGGEGRDKKVRQPRHCVICGKADCPGRTQRSRCKDFVAESLVVGGEDE